MGQSDAWHYSSPHGQFGPYTLDNLRITLAKIPNAKEVYVWREGMINWQNAWTFPELGDVLRSSPPPPPPPVPLRSASPRPSSTPKIIKACIAIFVAVAVGKVIGTVVGGLSGPACRAHDAEWKLVKNSHGTYTTNYAVNSEWCLFTRSLFFPEQERLFVPPGTK